MNVSDSLLSLRACATAREVSARLAAESAKISGASAAGVFLRDYAGETLVLDAFFPAVPKEEGGAVPIVSFDDPLVFCLHKGTRYSMPLSAGADSEAPSVALLSASAGTPPVRSLAAIPLTAPGAACLGALLLLFPQPEPGACSACELLCLYASAALHIHLERARTGKALRSLGEDFERLSADNRKSRESLASLVGISAPIASVRQRLEKIARADVPVLITGETGTGKGLAAKILHDAGPRSSGPFLEVNCGALPANLLESELFGHCKGAFSGADKEHPGLFRTAHGGTLLLDEIGEIPPELQAALLHVIQEKRVRPVGGVRLIPIDVRIVAATNRDLRQDIKSGRFREDLFHRLAFVDLHMPPLRERSEDIPLLAARFLEECRRRYGRPDVFIAPKTLNALMNRRFPGNVRELCACMERAVLLMEPHTSEILPEHLFPSENTVLPPGRTLAEYLARREELVIRSTLEFYGGNIRLCAESLGIPRRTLARKALKYRNGCDDTVQQ